MARSLAELGEVSRKILFLYNNKMVGTHFDQIQFSESPHELADPWTGGADHIGQFAV